MNPNHWKNRRQQPERDRYERNAIGPLSKTSYTPPTMVLALRYHDHKQVELLPMQQSKWLRNLTWSGFLLVLAGIGIVFLLLTFTMMAFAGKYDWPGIILVIGVILLFLIPGLIWRHIAINAPMPPGPLFDRPSGEVRLEGHPPYKITDLDAWFFNTAPIGPAAYIARFMYVRHTDPVTGNKGKPIDFLPYGSMRTLRDAEAAWATLAQFCDPTQPLPNVPEFWTYKLFFETDWDGLSEPPREAVAELVNAWAERLQQAGHRRAAETVLDNLHAGEDIIPWRDDPLGLHTDHPTLKSEGMLKPSSHL